MMQALKKRLSEREQKNLYRHRKVVDSAQGVEVRVDGKTCLNFCSNDYLNLANHPELIKAFKKGADQYGVGSGASHLVSGHSKAHHQLEEELAAFTGRDRALVFSSGYMANIGVISALVGKGDSVFEDKLNHASLLDGGLISGARFQRYAHNDMDSLLAKLENRTGNSLVISDGVFSMDGDMASLNELAKITQEKQAWLMVDDAHGFGVLGEKGAGCAELFNLNQKQLPILMGTFGKALGTAGAFVAGSEELIESLIQFARTYIYTTALPPALAEATRTSLSLIKEETWRRENLKTNIDYFCAEAEDLKIKLMPSKTAIQPVLVGGSEQVMKVGGALLEKGFWVGSIRPPTVPEDTARLRITLSAEHTEAQINELLQALQGVLRKHAAS